MTPTVFVVDADPSTRQSLSLLIRREGWCPETFACAEELLARGRVSAPSCLLLDIALPGLRGLDLQKRIASEWTSVPIIVITGHADVPTTVQAMKAGACEFFLKPHRDDRVVAAIEIALTRSIVALRREKEHQVLQERFDSLSRREREVMALVVAGLLNKQVGSELGISEITVKAHRANAMRKMRADSLAALVIFAARLDAARSPSSSLHGSGTTQPCTM